MNDLILKDENLLKKLNEKGDADFLKPLKKEIYLKSVFVEGLLFDGSAKLATLKNGDELILRRETQPYDVFGVSVLDKKEQLIGELSALDNEIFARLLDAGKKLSVKVKQVVILPEYNSLEVSISMIDF